MPLLPILYGLLSSRIANILIALAVGFGWGWVNTSMRWREYMKQQQAAQQVLHQMELRRQAENAKEIAAAATQRAEDDATLLAKLQKHIDDFDKGEANAKDPCTIDDAFHAAARGLRQPAKPVRPAKVTRPAKPVR